MLQLKRYSVLVFNRKTLMIMVLPEDEVIDNKCTSSSVGVLK